MRNVYFYGETNTEGSRETEKEWPRISRIIEGKKHQKPLNGKASRMNWGMMALNVAEKTIITTRMLLKMMRSSVILKQ